MCWVGTRYSTPPGHPAPRPRVHQRQHGETGQHGTAGSTATVIVPWGSNPSINSLYMPISQGLGLLPRYITYCEPAMLMTIKIFLGLSRRPYPILGRDPYSLSKTNKKVKYSLFWTIGFLRSWIWGSGGHLGTGLEGHI